MSSSQAKTNREQSWYLSLNGQNLGPFSDEDIRMMLKTGEINSSTMIWCEGMKDWSPIGLSVFNTSATQQARQELENDYRNQPQNTKVFLKILGFGVVVACLVIGAANFSTFKSKDHKQKDSYTVYYGEKPLVTAQPTGESQCDDVRKDVVAKINALIEVQYRKMEDLKKGLLKNNGEAYAVNSDGSSSRESMVEAGSQIGEALALPKITQSAVEAINKSLQNSGCLHSN